MSDLTSQQFINIRKFAEYPQISRWILLGSIFLILVSVLNVPVIATPVSLNTDATDTIYRIRR
jgi:hypothetical protein